MGTGNYTVSSVMQAELNADVEDARARLTELEGRLENLPSGSFSHFVRADLEGEIAELETQLRDYDLPEAADWAAGADASIADDLRAKAEAREQVRQDQLDAESADARVLESGSDYDRHHFINPRTGLQYTDAEVRYIRDTADFREGLTVDERIEFDRLFYGVGVGFDFDDALTIVGRDWHDAFNADGNGLQRGDLRNIAENEDGIFSSDQQAAAYYLLSRPEAFNSLESNYGSGYPVHDGAIGEDNIITAGGEIGPTIEQRIEAQKAALEGLEGQSDVDSEAVSQAITVLDAAQETLTPAEYARVSNYLSNVALGGQAVIALESALTGDYDEAYETAFDAAVPFAIKQILIRVAPSVAGGPVGIGVTALSLLLAFTPLDTSETRVASFSENAGEITPTGQRSYPGGYGTQINGNGFADPMYRG
jgi:hypothetical protein